ncbi:Os12g0408800, partial [Oryza sativa Japonica Group]
LEYLPCACRLSLSLVPILFGLGNYKKLIRKGKQLILHGLNEVIPRWACNRREDGTISSHS